MFKNKLSVIAISVSFALLNGCGGGGGGGASGPVASTLSFPVQAGYHALVAAGWSKTFTISGTCSGSGNRTNAPAVTATTFEGNPAMSAAETINMTLTNCTPASSATTATNYYDTSYNPVGFNSVGVNYGVYLVPITIPASVTVGGTGILGTETLYTDSTKATPNGRIDGSYVVTADTANTAIVTQIGKIYNTSGVLTSTEQDAWRIGATGTLTPISVDIQDANGSTTHIVLTYN